MRTPELYSVVGYWADSNQRACELIEATGPRDAENQMLKRARDEGGTFLAAGTLLGAHKVSDRYTMYIDPDDPKNEDEELEVVLNEPHVIEWSVFGLVVSLDDEEWNTRTGGERYLERHMAYHPRVAEDLARIEVRERGGVDVVVCAVFPGGRHRCENFRFANHDEPLLR